MKWLKSKKASTSIKYTKYTASDLYWMKNNLFSDITFCMHNNLKMIINIFSTIYLALTVLFPSVSSYWNHEQGQLPISIFYFIRFYVWFKIIILADQSEKTKFNPRSYYISLTLFFKTRYLR